jgi:hypothetical protein
MRNFYKITIFAFMLFSDFVVFAQGGPGDDDDDGGLEGGDPAPAPINSKLIYLALVGILFVMYKRANSKKQA